MKRLKIIILFILINIVFVLLYIYQQNQIIKYSYIKQKVETEKGVLKKQKQALIHSLYTLHNPGHIKEFAHTILHFKSVKIGQVKKINYDTTT